MGHLYPAVAVRAFALLTAFALVTAHDARAQSFNWLVPAGGGTWTAGTTHTIEWSGGPAGNVLVNIVSLSPFQVAANVATNVPNTGYASWSIPGGLPAGAYQAYVQDMAATTWLYSQTFYIQAGPVCATGCYQVSASLPWFGYPAAICAPDDYQAAQSAQSYIQAQLASQCTSGYALNLASVVIDVTPLAFGSCLAGYTGPAMADVSAIGCCCPTATPTRPSTWGRIKAIYR